MISNSSPLILLAKINEVDILGVFNELLIHEEVYKEIMKGKLSNSPDAFTIEGMVEEGKIRILNLNENGKKVYEKITGRYKSLDAGEAATIALALQRDEERVLVDESIARRVCKLVGLRPVGSLGVVLLAYKNGIIDENRVKIIVRKMVSSDFRVSASVTERFWELFEKMER